MTLELAPDARAFIAHRGFDPVYRGTPAAPVHRPRSRDPRRPRTGRRRRARRRGDQRRSG
nr:hypothetical protein [Trebonia kvetii]